GFGRRVIRLADVAHPTCGRDINNPARAGSTHDAACRPGHEKDAGEINGDYLVPLFVCHFVQHGITINSSVIHQDVQASSALVDVFDGGVAFGGTGNIQAYTQGPIAAVGGDPFGIDLVDIGTDDECAFVSELA